MVIGHEPALSEAVAVFVGGGNFKRSYCGGRGHRVDVAPGGHRTRSRRTREISVRPRMLERS